MNALSCSSRLLRASSSGLALSAVLAAATSGTVLAAKTCQSPYMAKITGEEEFVYVWTLGVEGLGDGSDKVVTVDVRPTRRPSAGSSTLTPWAAGTRRITAASPTTAASSG